MKRLKDATQGGLFAQLNNIEIKERDGKKGRQRGGRGRERQSYKLAKCWLTTLLTLALNLGVKAGSVVPRK